MLRELKPTRVGGRCGEAANNPRGRAENGLGLRQRVGQAVKILFPEVRLLLFRQHEHGFVSVLDVSDAPPEVITRAESSINSSLTS